MAPVQDLSVVGCLWRTLQLNILCSLISSIELQDCKIRRSNQARRHIAQSCQKLTGTGNSDQSRTILRDNAQLREIQTAD